jgi:hypothetical protein
MDGQNAPICAEAMRLKRIIRPLAEDSKEHYMQVTRLVNKEKTGFLPALLKVEKEIFAETTQFLKTAHTGEELRAFQEKMAQKALAALDSISK